MNHRLLSRPESLITSGPAVPPPLKLSQLMPIVLLKCLREVAREKGEELREKLKQR